jgi:glycosyltransferase involved in cell wall biosynthesis
MGFGNCVVAAGTAENEETMGEAGYSYGDDAPVENLRALLQRLVDAPEEVGEARARAGERARATFSWEQVTDAYEALFHRMLNPTARPLPRSRPISHPDFREK